MCTQSINFVYILMFLLALLEVKIVLIAITTVLINTIHANDMTMSIQLPVSQRFKLYFDAKIGRTVIGCNFKA